MVRFTKVTLKDGREITVMEREVPGLQKAGLLKETTLRTRLKEEKDTGETKEFKTKGQTKGNITRKNVKGSRSKKT